MPIGTILMYDGTGIAEVETREVEIGAHGSDTIEMSGWFACNGLVNTPNLIGSFTMGFLTSGGVGGSNDAVVVEHTHGASSTNAGSHNHGVKVKDSTPAMEGVINEVVGSYPWTLENTLDAGSHNHPITVNNQGVSGVGANLPQYYSVIYIIRMS